MTKKQSLLSIAFFLLGNMDINRLLVTATEGARPVSSAEQSFSNYCDGNGARGSFCSHFLPFAFPRSPQIRDRSTIHSDIIRVIELIFAHSAGSSYKCTRHDKVKSFRSNSIHNNCAHYPNHYLGVIHTQRISSENDEKCFSAESSLSSPSRKADNKFFSVVNRFNLALRIDFFSSLFQLFRRVLRLICGIRTKIVCEAVWGSFGAVLLCRF